MALPPLRRSPGQAPVIMNKTGVPAMTPNRNVATEIAPAASQGQADSRTQTFTYFTKVPVVGQPPEILYNGERQWVTIVLTLETAGPVSVGPTSGLAPLLSGKGTLLETGVPFRITIAKGTRLFILADGINRVKVIIEPLPWLEQITGQLGNWLSAVGAALRHVVK